MVMKTKSTWVKVGIFAAIATVFFLLAACASPAKDNGNSSSPRDAASNGEDGVLVLHLTFVDDEGSPLGGDVIDQVVNDTDFGSLTTDADGTVTIGDIQPGDSIDVTVYDENGSIAASSRIYVYTAEVNMYTENSDGVLYLYAEAGVTELNAQMQLNDGQTFDCIDLVT